LPPWLLAAWGGRHVGTRATYVKRLGHPSKVPAHGAMPGSDETPDDKLSLAPAKPRGPVIREYAESVADPSLRTLAIEAGALSRFHVDPDFPRELFEMLYETWIDKSLPSRPESRVYVCGDAANLTGLLTVQFTDEPERSARLGLLAVSPQARGLGIARAMIQHVNCAAQARGMTDITVCTQGENVAACRLYEQAGYERVALESCYHFWLDRTADGDASGPNRSPYDGPKS
jgi:ribosomal protein S18 acetylase RimI-like enzyme